MKKNWQELFGVIILCILVAWITFFSPVDYSGFDSLGTLLTSQAIGAWGLGIGVIVLHASWENDWDRLFPMILSYTVFGTLQGINLLRYPATLDWSRFSTITYTIFVSSILLVSLLGLRRAWQVKQDRISD